jgi:hypothetical protein
MFCSFHLSLIIFGLWGFGLGINVDVDVDGREGWGPPQFYSNLFATF